MKTSLHGLAGAMVLLLCGCGNPTYTENDLGSTVTLDQGSEFTITLARVPSGERKAPEIRGALIRLLDRRADADQERFHFMAEGVGEADVRIAGKDQTIPEFVILVRVLRAARIGSTAPPHHPPGD
jgi:hypothetical protein